MTVHFTFYPWIHYPILLGVVICLVLVFTAWRRRPIPGAQQACWVLLSALVWMIGTFFEHGSSTLSEKLFWIKVQYPGIAFIGLFWLMLVLEYLDYIIITRRSFLLLSIIPLGAVLLNWTNEFHHLYYTQSWVDTHFGMPYMVLAHGSIFWVFIAYSCSLYLTGLFLCGFAITQAFPVYRRQMLVLFCGAMIPATANIMYLCHLGPLPTLDFTPLVFPISGILITLGLRHCELWKLTPVAHHIIIQSMMDGVLVLDPDGRILEANPAAGQFLDIPGSYIIGQPLREVASWIPWQPNAPVSGESVVTVTVSHDPLRVYEIHLIPIIRRDVLHTGDLIHLRDITEHQRAELALQEMAYYDPLTGLPNRRGAIDRLGQALLRGRRNKSRTTVLYLDLDRFKEVNDSWGHTAGDAVLCETALRVTSCVRASDTVARLGGDEFLVILPDQGSDTAIEFRLETTVKRILQAFQTPMDIDGHAIVLSPSIGMATSSDETINVNDLIDHADRAMYAAKRDGRNTYRDYATLTRNS